LNLAKRNKNADICSIGIYGTGCRSWGGCAHALGPHTQADPKAYAIPNTYSSTYEQANI